MACPIAPSLLVLVLCYLAAPRVPAPELRFASGERFGDGRERYLARTRENAVDQLIDALFESLAAAQGALVTAATSRFQRSP